MRYYALICTHIALYLRIFINRSFWKFWKYFERALKMRSKCAQNALKMRSKCAQIAAENSCFHTCTYTTIWAHFGRITTAVNRTAHFALNCACYAPNMHSNRQMFTQKSSSFAVKKRSECALSALFLAHMRSLAATLTTGQLTAANRALQSYYDI